MKKKNNKIILSLGSNKDAVTNIEFARKRLSLYFSEISFSENIFTRPVNWITEDMFLNSVAIAFTNLEKEEVNIFFKNLEIECGRSRELKAKGVVPLDIDLLKWNNEIIKRDDIQRDYIIKLLRTLGENVN